MKTTKKSTSKPRPPRQVYLAFSINEFGPDLVIPGAKRKKDLQHFVNEFAFVAGPYVLAERAGQR